MSARYLLRLELKNAGSKDGRAFHLDTANLGHFNSIADQNPQTFQATGRFFGASVYYDSKLYVWGGGGITGWRQLSHRNPL